jgi:hypothetical protein
MLTAIAVPYSALPLEFIAAFGLEQRVHERGGERELQFRQASARSVLPVWHEGRFLLALGLQARGKPRAAGVRLDQAGHGGIELVVGCGGRGGRDPGVAGAGWRDLVRDTGGHPWVTGA